MELQDLQELWQQTDRKISDNIQLNREILRRMLMSKPERRINWMRAKALFNLILPIFAITVILLPNLRFRPTIDFYIAISIFILFSIVTYLWAVKYYLLINKIKFSDSILTIKKNVSALSQFKIKITRISFLFSPIMMLGIFLMVPIHITGVNQILKFSAFVGFIILCAFFSYRTIIRQHQKLNDEILEIEELEKNL